MTLTKLCIILDVNDLDLGWIETSIREQLDPDEQIVDIQQEDVE